MRADPPGVLANKLAPLSAHALRRQGRPVPPIYETQARLAKTAWMTSIPLLARIRAACEGPLLLFKGPEAGALYPDRARSFMDIDLLVPHADKVHAALRANGFIAVDDGVVYEDQDYHHLRPLQWPELWLTVEVHVRAPWPDGHAVPPIGEIVERAVPSATGVRGISAPHPAHHAIILAAHAWMTQPLETLRDLVDIAAVAAQTDEPELTAAARAWGVERIWRTSYGATRSLLGGPQRSAAVRIWGRHLPRVEERSVLGNHLQRWLHNFWGQPMVPALRSTRAALRQEIFPYPGESWREKLIRVRYAFADPSAPVSAHEKSWQTAAGAGGDRGNDEAPGR